MGKCFWVGTVLGLAAAVAMAEGWALKPGQTGLGGRVASVAAGFFTLDVSLVALAGGKEHPLDPPRRKVVHITAQTGFVGAKGLAGLKPGAQVRVVGKDAGPGKPLTATRVEASIGAGAAGTTAAPGGMPAAGAGLGPWEALVGGAPGDAQPIEILDLKSGQTRPVPGNAGAGESPRIAPGRASYYFWRDLKSTPKLVAARLGSAPTVLRPWPDGTEASGSCWSPDGKRIYAAQAQKAFDLTGFALIILPFPAGFPQTVRLENDLFGGISTIIHEVVALRTAPDLLATNHNWHEMIAIRPPSGTGKRVTSLADWDEAQLGVAKGVIQPEPFNPRQDRATGRVFFSIAYLVAQLETETSDQAKAVGRHLGIFTMAPDGTDVTRVPIDAKGMPDGAVRQPYLVDLSPDGKTLLMTYWKTPGLYTVPAAGGTPTPVPGKGAALSEASWSG